MRLSFLHLPFTLALFFSSLAQADSKAFQTGIEFFKQNRYAQAIEQFDRALQQGDQRAAVHYNLAVSHYKLNKLQDAQKHFRLAARNDKFYSLSAYSQGLIEAKRDRLQTAIRYFEQVRKDSPLYARAKRMIAKIENEFATRNKPYTDFIDGSVNLSFGNDSNVNRANDNSPRNISDSYNSVYASISLPLGKQHTGIGFGASYFNLNYSTLNSDDFSSLRASMFYKTRLGDWKTRSTLSLSSSDLGPTALQDTTRLSVAGSKRLSRDASVKLDVQLDNIRSGDVQYDYLQGSRQRLRGAYRTRFGKLRVDARYRLELNNRDDLANQSFSPTRHTLRAISSYRFTPRLKTSLDLAWRSSDYPAKGTNPGRTEDRLRIAARMQYRFNKNWLLEGFARQTRNDSDNPLYDYNRSDVYLGVNYRY